MDPEPEPGSVKATAQRDLGPSVPAPYARHHSRSGLLVDDIRQNSALAFTPAPGMEITARFFVV
jgi:hypothetical protein